MSVEQAIHAALAAVPELTALVPATRIITGWQEPDDEWRPDVLPFATLEHVDEDEVETTSSGGRLATVTLRLSAWSESLDALKRFGDLVERTLWRHQAACGDRGKIIHIERGGRSESRLSSGPWRLELELLVRTAHQF